MAMMWDNRNDRFYFEMKNTGGYFEEHSEHMRIFREFHAYGREMETSEHNSPTLLENGQPLLFPGTISATGGSRSTIAPADWLPLIPMWKVSLRRFSDN